MNNTFEPLNHLPLFANSLTTERISSFKKLPTEFDKVKVKPVKARTFRTVTNPNN